MFKLVNKCKNENKDFCFITIAGNVGAGKSTLTKLLGEKLNFQTHFEKVDDNPYLGDFYLDQKKYGFHLQLYFLSQRFRQQKEIQALGINTVQDRSIYEDVGIFAKNLYDNNVMTQRDYITYRDLFNDMVPYLKKPDLMIYLDCSIDTILHRIALRGREIEKDVDLEYWKNLHNRYQNWIENYTESPVLYINMDKIDLVKYPEQIDLVCDEIKKILNI